MAIPMDLHPRVGGRPAQSRLKAYLNRKDTADAPLGPKDLRAFRSVFRLHLSECPGGSYPSASTLNLSIEGEERVSPVHALRAGWKGARSRFAPYLRGFFLRPTNGETGLLLNNKIWKGTSGVSFSSSRTRLLRYRAACLLETQALCSVASSLTTVTTLSSP